MALTKLHKLFFILNFSLMLRLLPGNAYAADAVLEGIQSRLKDQVLTEVISSLELRDGGMCFFLPQGKDFHTKVAINCTRLFDSILDELFFGTEPSLFEDNVITRLSNSKEKRRLLEVFQGDLSAISQSRVTNGNIANEELSPIILEMSKLGVVLLRGTLGRDEQISIQFLDVVRRFSDELADILIEFHLEESVSVFGSLLWNELKEDKSILDLRFILASLYGGPNDVFEVYFELYKKNGTLFIDQFDKLNLLNEHASMEVQTAISEVKQFLDNCLAADLNLISENCAELATHVGPDFRSEFNKQYLEKAKQYLVLNSAPSLQIIEQILSKGIKDSDEYQGFLNQDVRSLLKSREYLTEEDLKFACSILATKPCELSLKSSLSLFNLILFAIASTIIVLLFLIRFYNRKSSSKQNDPKIELTKTSLKNGELSSDERAELRSLRQIFELSPVEGVSDLHRNYRRLVFQVHPDKLKDGGKEFILLQSRYLKTKELLERLEKNRSFKRANS